jgi:F-type H+-transporting ATPase subunit b
MKKILPFYAGCCAVLYAAVLFASEAAEGTAHEGHTFMGDWLPRLINFAIIAFVVVYFMRRPAQDFFKNRTSEIAKALEESREARQRAEAALAEMEQKMKDLESETVRLIADAQARGEKDRQSLIAEGKKVAQEVQEQVKQGVEIEVEKAKNSLATEASLLSLDLAEGRIKDKIGSQDHERIVKEYIDKVGGRG